MEDMVITARFADAGEARGALHHLQRLDDDGRLHVRAAALLERSGQDRITLSEGARDESTFMPQAGIVGMLVDAVSGPPGALFARPTEGFYGRGGKPDHKGEYDLVLEEISRTLEPGVTLVIAEITDPDPDVLDATLGELGGRVTRRAAHDVYAEIQAAEQAAGGAGEQVRRTLREQRRDQRRAQWERFKENAKSKLP